MANKTPTRNSAHSVEATKAKKHTRTRRDNEKKGNETCVLNQISVKAIAFGQKQNSRAFRTFIYIFISVRSEMLRAPFKCELPTKVWIHSNIPADCVYGMFHCNPATNKLWVVRSNFLLSQPLQFLLI